MYILQRHMTTTLLCQLSSTMRQGHETSIEDSAYV